MDEILKVIEDPDLRGVLTMYPQQHYVCDPRGGPNMRVWTDVHTADDWWSLQVLSHSTYFAFFACSENRLQDKVGPEKVIIHVRLYSDATQLNKMGTKKCWGVYMYIGNVPQELRISHRDKGGAVLLGCIPEVSVAALIISTV